jgi:hypothetical protein
MKSLYYLIALFIPLHLLYAGNELDSSAYLSGYTWYYFSDWKLMGQDYGGIPPQSFDPQLVKLGDTIFVDYTSLGRFASDYLPKINTKVILITPNYGYDADSPMPGPYAFLLEEDKIGAWFLQNIDRPSSEKLIPIPIGLANPIWAHGDTALLDRMIPRSLAKQDKSIFLYLNLTFRPERADCFDHFRAMGSTFTAFNHFGSYVHDLSKSLFVVSPRGHGLDTHRTWEALLMGCYPIVPSSTLNPLYEDLPVVIVNSWKEVTTEFLEEWHRKLASKQWCRDKLYAPYWFKKVKAIQDTIRGNAQLSNE